MDRVCSNCFHFELGNENIGTCLRYPVSLSKRPGDRCGEFKLGRIDTKLLCTPVNAPGWFSAYTLGILRRRKIKTVSDLVNAGRTGIIRVGGGLDSIAIAEVSAKLAEHGIDW